MTVSFQLADPDIHPRTAGRHYKAHEPIFHQGDESSEWFEVLEGAVATFHYSSNGQRQLTAFLYPGDVLGLDDRVREESAEAITAVLLRAYPQGALLTAAQSRQCSGSTLCGARRALNLARRSLLLFGRRTAIERIAALLLTLGDHSDDGDIGLQMSRNDIADHLGLTVHTVSRTLSQLVDRCVIAREDAHLIRIRDRATLGRLAGFDGADDS